MEYLLALAAEVLETARAMNASGINRGTAGNVSARCAALGSVPTDASPFFLITPTGMAYAACTPQDMVRVGKDGCLDDGLLAQNKPSSEWRFHHDIYAARPEAHAVIHTHSPFATALACQHLDVPAFHYMVARFGGDSVRCAGYATFGTQALSDAMLIALKERNACLMAHHGMVVFGRSLRQALDLAIELETLCEQYWRALQLGAAKVLPADEMQRVIEKFATYGQQKQPPATS
jgi:L-fuculose-phosphate aldolase